MTGKRECVLQRRACKIFTVGLIVEMEEKSKEKYSLYCPLKRAGLVLLQGS